MREKREHKYNTEKVADILCTIFVIFILCIWLFSINETLRHFGVLADLNDTNPFGFVVLLVIFGILVSSKDVIIGVFLWIVSIIFFLLFVFYHFQEINIDQYKRIENIDKTTIKSFIGDKDYVNGWDYLNILENKENVRRDNALKLKDKELEETRNKVK